MKFISLFPTVPSKRVIAGHPFDAFVNDFFKNGFPTNSNTGTVKTPAVNVVENDDAYRIEVAAPGLAKGDFEVKLDKDLLTISAKKETTAQEGEKYTRKEFSYFEFQRSFTLPETVDAEGIAATYENGILNVTLAKKPEAKPQPARAIEVA